eukprot:TRINITY_DN4970_c0_g1_i2.p1 TRINITY_DN4970_c0_g1~~TRINITY_DN4970_c0_g1_i2.p1  ORF type:complete len:169 (+),score=52.74 TRINITY_DN4970_c0_g1_i2:117-623(+)
MANDPSKTLEEIEDGHEENVAHDQDLLDEAAHDGGATDDTAGTSQELMKRKKKKAHRRPTLNEIAKCCDKAAEEDIEKIRQLDRESAELTTERARRVAHLKKRALHHEAEAAFARALNKQRKFLVSGAAVAAVAVVIGYVLTILFGLLPLLGVGAGAQHCCGGNSSSE